MTLIVHSPDSLALASRKVFEAAVFEAAVAAAARAVDVGVVSVVIDGADRVHYHTGRQPTVTVGMLSSDPLQPLISDLLGELGSQAFAAAAAVADEYCVGFALVLVDGNDRLCHRSSMGPVMTVGMLRRAAGLFDITNSTPFTQFLSGAGGVVGTQTTSPTTTATGGNGAAQVPEPASPLQPSDDPPTV